MTAMLMHLDPAMRTSLTKKEEFFAELSALIRSEGIACLGVGEIAERLRCSRRRIYEVAPTKKGLLLAVARQHFRNSLNAGFKAAAAEWDSARRLVAYFDAAVRSSERVSSAFLSDLQQSDEGRALLDAYQLRRSEGSREIFEAGVRCGEFRPLNFEVMTEMLLAATLRLRDPDFLRRASLTLPEALGQAYSLVLQGLLEDNNVRVGPHQRTDSLPGC